MTDQQWVQAWKPEEIKNWDNILNSLNFILNNEILRQHFPNNNITCWGWMNLDNIYCFTPPATWGLIANNIKIIPYSKTKSGIVFIFNVYGMEVFLLVTNTGIKSDPKTLSEKDFHTNTTDVPQLVDDLLSSLKEQMVVYQSIK